MFSVKIHTENLEALVERVTDFIETKPIPIMAKITLADVKSKMTAGEKPEGGSYEGYQSERYKRYRRNHDKQTEHVDFEVTGELKKNIKFFEDDSMISVEEDYDKIATGLTEGNGNGLIARDFFAGPGQDTIDKGIAEITEEFNKLV